MKHFHSIIEKIKNLYYFLKCNIIKIILLFLLIIFGISLKFYYNAVSFFNSEKFMNYQQIIEYTTNTISDSNGNLLGFSSKYYREPIKNIHLE